MAQQGQVFPLAGQGRDGTRWAYRYRVGGRGSRRVQRGGFASEQAAAEALERALEQLRREQGLVESPTLAEFIDIYLAQHEGEPETTEKLRWLLAKAMRAFGERRLSELRSPAIAAWRMTIPPGHRFEATQALRQVLARAVEWGLLDVNPAKLGVENPQRRYTEKRPFDSWDELCALAGRLGPRHGPMVLFAAATGLRPGEWLALEHRDVDRESRVVYVRRTFRNGRIKTPKTKASVRALRKALARLRPGGCAATMTVADLVEKYLGMHQGEPVTIAKLRWLLGQATSVLGLVRLADVGQGRLRLAADDPGGAPLRGDPGCRRLRPLGSIDAPYLSRQTRA